MLQLRNSFLPPHTYFQICLRRANSTRRSKECGNPTVARCPSRRKCQLQNKKLCIAMIRSFQQAHKLLYGKSRKFTHLKNKFPKYPSKNSQENALKGSKICKQFVESRTATSRRSHSHFCCGSVLRRRGNGATTPTIGASCLLAWSWAGLAASAAAVSA